jgi:hypothetical protein
MEIKIMAKQEISWGKRMIKVSIHFWTDSLPRGSDLKTAWAAGAIHMVANKQRGIKHDNVLFNHPEELLPKLQELVQRNGVKLVKPPKKTEPVDFSKITS